MEGSKILFKSCSRRSAAARTGIKDLPDFVLPRDGVGCTKTMFFTTALLNLYKHNAGIYHVFLVSNARSEQNAASCTGF